MVLDVGAYAGDYARHVIAAQPTARVYAFEPHPQTFLRLREVAQHTGFSAHQVACESGPGALYLYDYREQNGSQHASVHAAVIEGLHGATAVRHRVKQMTLDSFIKCERIARVDLLKIDTEGHELEVLKGCRCALSSGKIAAIQFEFNYTNVASRVFFRDFYVLLPGYDFFRLLPHGLLLLGHYDPLGCEIFQFQNVVALFKERT